MSDGIRWETGERVMTPGGVQELYSWHPDFGTVLTVDADGGMHEWQKSQLQPMPPVTGPRQYEAQWALRLYHECQRDAAADPWWDPGGAERRFLAKLREYAGEAE